MDRGKWKRKGDVESKVLAAHVPLNKEVPQTHRLRSTSRLGIYRALLASGLLPPVAAERVAVHDTTPNSIFTLTHPSAAEKEG
jgi:hypothetical protein